jgi:hypothetical protein
MAEEARWQARKAEKKLAELQALHDTKMQVRARLQQRHIPHVGGTIASNPCHLRLAQL